jgi:hypothetical protein
VATGEQASTPISHFRERSTPALSAEGFERRAPLTAVAAGETVCRTERRLVIRSHQLAQAGEKALGIRLAKAQAAVVALHDQRRGEQRLTELSALQEAVAPAVHPRG